MQRKGHIITFFSVLTLVMLIAGFLPNVIQIVYMVNFALLATFFAIFFSSDIDQIDDFKWALTHRDWKTHSCLPAVAFYWLAHPYLLPATMKEFGAILFLPFIVHLIADLGGVKGFGLIKFGRWTFSMKWSYVWFIVNIVFMATYFVWVT